MKVEEPVYNAPNYKQCGTEQRGAYTVCHYVKTHDGKIQISSFASKP